jgi:hypothetical protein
MDPATPLFAIMAFFLIAIILTGGFVLLMPLSRQLAKYLEYRMKDNPGLPPATDEEIRQLRSAIESMQRELRGVSDRQAFVEKLLENRSSETNKLPLS